MWCMRLRRGVYKPLQVEENGFLFPPGVNTVISLQPFLRRCFFAGLVLPAACATSSVEQAGMAQLCPNPRPQNCTMIYRPVCGERADASQKTYSNACVACADASVVSWVEDPCPE